MVAKFSIPGDHTSLQGHFPGNPVVPGVVILNEVVKLVEKTLTGKSVVGIKYVKFIKPLRSDMEMILHIEEVNADILDITCEHDDSVIVKGQLVLSEKEMA